MKVTIYCGRNFGTNPNIKIQAAELCQALATQGHELVYGGGHLGLMGLCAEEFHKLGAKVHGIIPKHIHIKRKTEDWVNLTVTETMRERKELLISEGSVWIALPGGIGTLEEVFSTLSSIKHQNLDSKMIILNVDGFYDGLKLQLELMTEQGMINEEYQGAYVFADSVNEIVEIIRN